MVEDEVEYTLDEILEFKKALKNWKEGDLQKTFNILSKLNSANFTRDLLKLSKIGLYVKNISRQVDLSEIDAFATANGDS